MFVKPRYLLLFIFILFSLVTLSFNDYIHAQNKPKEMNIHFINVGQGDSILIETPSEKTMLIDGGPPKAGGKVIDYLKQRGIDEIDLLVATHPDIDHIGGLVYVLKNMKVHKVLDTGKLHTTATYGRYVKQIRQKKIPVTIAEENDRVHLDRNILIHVLNSYEYPKNNNQSSIVLKIQYDDIAILLLGDVEKKQEKRLLKHHRVEADIVKVAHHGSKTSSSLDFLNQVNPSVAFITYSKKNKFGHPVNKVIERLHKVNANIYSTAVYGDVLIKTDGNDFLIVPEKGPLEGILENSG